MENTTNRTVHKLTSKQVWEVTNIVKEEYEKAGISDVEFAKQLTARLGYHVSYSSIATSRDIVGVKATREKQLSVLNAEELSAELNKLQQRIKVLEDRFDVFTSGCRK